jgi:hypothetical protein
VVPATVLFRLQRHRIQPRPRGGPNHRCRPSTNRIVTQTMTVE